MNSPLTICLFARFALALLVVSATFVAPVFAAGDNDWLPIEAQHLALKAPVVEKDADAEALFWQVRVADLAEGGDTRNVIDNYIRIKIFNERGREAKSKIELPYLNGSKIKDISARTIKPDGSIVELDKKDIFDKTVVRYGNLKLKAKSFAMPAVEPGAIIEYRWREVSDYIKDYLRLNMQQDVPVQLITYSIKPLVHPYFPYGMRVQSFNFKYNEFKKEKNGYYTTSLTNVPAFREEPRMPPPYDVRQWMLVYYSEDKKLIPAKYWREHGKYIFNLYKNAIKPNDEVRAKAAEIVGDAATPDDKLTRLYNFCRANIKNISGDTSGFSNAEIEKLKDNKKAGDTLKRGYGTVQDIDLLFASLVTAVGLDARVAVSGNRSDVSFRPEYADTYFMKTYSIAVRVPDEKTKTEWRFFDPGAPYVPQGMLLWLEEGETALVSDPNEPVFVTTPISQPEQSVKKRFAKLTLAEDGTLEGDVTAEYTGHFSVTEKGEHDDESADEQIKNITDELKSELRVPELTNLKVENLTDPVKPLKLSFHIRIPAYAQRTGKRLFIQPSVFYSTRGTMFPTSTRVHPVFFTHPYSEKDTITIQIPNGFTLENPEAPQPFSAGEISRYDVKLSISKDKSTLIYERAFRFGGGGNVYFPRESYPQLKKYFDSIHEQDKHSIALKADATQ